MKKKSQGKPALSAPAPKGGFASVKANTDGKKGKKTKGC